MWMRKIRDGHVDVQFNFWVEAVDAYIDEQFG
jgi:hypothetical protein